MSTNNERLAVLETRVASLEQTTERIEQKLDELISLKHKGQGAFWLATALVGAGFAVALSALAAWFRG